MNIENFIEKFAEQINCTDIKILNEYTQFKESDEWSSLMALFIICMADEDYNVTLNREDILRSNTIGDIYNIIQSKR